MSERNQVKLLVMSGISMACIVYLVVSQVNAALAPLRNLGFGDGGEVVSSGMDAAQAIVAALIALVTFIAVLSRTLWEFIQVQFLGYEYADETEDEEEVEYEDEVEEEAEMSESELSLEGSVEDPPAEDAPAKAVKKTVRRTAKKPVKKSRG